MKESEKLYLVTGGAGFVGSNLIEGLNTKYPNTHIYSLDNYFTGKKENHIVSPNVEYLEGHTKNIAEIWKSKGLPPPSAVFHLGEYSRIVQSFEDIDLVFDLNQVGTKEVVKFSQENNSKLIYAGSSSKFGNEGKDENLSPYAWIKAKNIELIKNWKKWFDAPEYVITYFYNVYGPKEIREGKYATVIGKFQRLYENGEKLTVYGSGDKTRDFTHVSDIVNGIIICAEKGSGDGYQLGFGKERSILEIARMFGADVSFVSPKKGERQRGRATSSLARDLGWKPTIDIKDYIEDFVRKVQESRKNS